jgi:quercetin dioxygenase-like cupin family protein
MKISQGILWPFVAIGGYFLTSCLCHYIIFPEALPTDQNYPRQGDIILNASAGERVQFVKDRFQGNPNEVIIEVELDAHGSIPMSHVHINMNEVFTGLEAQTSLEVNGTVHTLENSQSVTVAAGAPHLPYNASATPSKIQVAMEPIGSFDLCLVNIHRTLAKEPSEQSWLSQQLQLSRYAYFCDVYRGDIPVWVQQAGLFFITPTIRALGYHAWKATTP